MYTTGKQLQFNWLQASLLERERERERESTLSAEQANLIRDRSIYSTFYDNSNGFFKITLKRDQLPILKQFTTLDWFEVCLPMYIKTLESYITIVGRAFIKLALTLDKLLHTYDDDSLQCGQIKIAKCL